MTNSGPGRGSVRGQGHGHGRGRGHEAGSRAPSGGRGRGRGRARDAMYRSRQWSTSSAGSRLGDGSAESASFLTSQPRKQPPLNGLHELLVGLRGNGRGYWSSDKAADSIPSAFGCGNRRGGRMSWADMRRQSQRSNSTADESSEPDGSHRAFLNVGGLDGGWGGRGRGRILDISSAKKPDSVEDNDANVWRGRGRGGILYVPGVNFHSGPSSAGMLYYRHSVGGLQRKDSVATNVCGNKRSWKKKPKESNNEAKTENSQPAETSKKRETHSPGIFVPCIQRSDGKSMNNSETTEDVPSDVTTTNKQVVDIISPPEGDDKNLLSEGKCINVNNIEQNLQKLLNIGTHDVDTKKAVAPVNYSTELKSDRNENCKPGSFRGGRCRGSMHFGASLVTDRVTSDT